MHLEYGSQVRWKEDIFKQALRGIAHLKEQPSLRVHEARPEFYYRYRARLQIKSSSIGFYRRASNSIVSSDRCMLLPEVLNAAVEDLRSSFADNVAPPGLRSCEVALSPVDGCLTFYWTFNRVKGSGDAARSIMDGMEKIFAGRGVEIAGQAACDSRGVAIATRGGNLLLEVDDVPMPASPGTFFQVNPAVNTVLVNRILTHLRDMGSVSLLDLYCGNGNFSLPAAAAGMKTVGVESSNGAVQDAVSVSGPGSRFIEMDTAAFLASDNKKYDAVIVDPPRTGLPVEVIGSLAVKRFPFLIYVSCEPSTLARDLARLTEAGYAISDIELFDMFPQTSHSEALVTMKG